MSNIPLETTKILGISITSSSKKNILEYIEKYLFLRGKNTEIGAKNGQKPLTIVTPNPEQIILSRHNSNFAKTLNWADISIPDGIGVVWASRLLSKNTIANRISGIDFMQDLIRLAEEKSVRIGLIGAKGKLAEDAFNCLQKKYRNLDGFTLGEFSVDTDGREIDDSQNQFSSIIKHIKGPIILFIALGAPKQEFFMQRLVDQLKESGAKEPVVIMVVGGALDIITGRIPRAPKMMQEMGLEWLWRLFRQPWRWKRQIALIEYIHTMCFEYIKMKFSGT